MHQSLVKQWAEQLVADGVDVVLDIYDLKEGHDKFAFMERMVTDVSVTHVLIVSDKIYSTKADARKSGVGTESQIISKEVYEKVEQSKFVPIVCEFDEKGEPFLPALFKSRICNPIDAPPYTATTEMPDMYFLKSSISFTICMHSSLVGQTTKA